MPGDSLLSPRPKRRRLRTWFRDLRLSRKLLIVILVHLLHASVLLGVTAYGMKAISASRAYVEGEGLWGKAEKEGIIQLTAYVQNGDEAHYQAFLAEMNVTLGDHRARLEMDKANPDMQVVEDGFVAGRLSKEDVPNLAWLYRNFGWEPHISSAVQVWRVADENITILIGLAEQLHATVSAPVRDQAKVDALATQVYAMDDRLTVLENEFSRILGSGARWLASVATWSAIGLTVVFVGGALWISSVVARHVTRSMAKLQNAAVAVTAGNLTSRVALEGKDEVAAVGRAFDQMTQRLETLMHEGEQRAAALSESLAQFQALSEGSPLGIFHTDAKGRLDYANPAWIAIAGCDYHDVEAIRAAVHPDDVAGLAGRWHNCLKDAVELRAEFRYVHKDGTVVPCATRAMPLQDATGQLVGFVGTVEDMTERRRADEVARRDQAQANEIERLEELNAFRTNFINTAAHELRTPLTPMRAEMYLLRKLRSGNYNEKEQHSLDLLGRNLERLGGLVEELLEVARYQSGRLFIEPRPADLHKVVKEATESFVEASAQQGVKLEVRSAGDGSALLDAKRISQVVYNLLSNALKFTPTGGRVVVESAAMLDGLRLRVKDTGIGIKPEDVKRLFQPFSQVHDVHQTTQPGSGLGLYICRAILELHGGTIVATSEGLGHGTMITVTLPRHPPASPPVAPLGPDTMEP